MSVTVKLRTENNNNKNREDTRCVILLMKQEVLMKTEYFFL